MTTKPPSRPDRDGRHAGLLEAIAHLQALRLEVAEQAADLQAAAVAAVTGEPGVDLDRSFDIIEWGAILERTAAEGIRRIRAELAQLNT